MCPNVSDTLQTNVSNARKYCFHTKQECIPVGCVPSATVAVVGGGCLVPGGSGPGGCLVLGGSGPWGVGAWSRGGGIPACTEADPPHPVNRMTGRQV